MEEQLYRCYYDGCDRIYRTKYNLRRHINSNHLSIKEFLCQICSKSFASKQNLQGHERLHERTVTMPHLDIPALIKTEKKIQCEDLQIILLSKFYKDSLASYSICSNASMANMPILPPVSYERINENKKIKLPVLPILL